MAVISELNEAVDPPKRTCINDLPKKIIVHVLDRMPIQDAVKTSILCESWRFNWTMVRHLIFDLAFFIYLKRKFQEQVLVACYSKIVSRVLLHHRGNLVKIFLWRPEGIDHEDIDHWISYLLRKGVKEFIIDGTDSRNYNLPSSFCSFMELTHLKLKNCWLKATPSFIGFPSLKELELLDIRCDSGVSWKFIHGCPLLEKLVFHGSIYQWYINKIAELENLRKYTLDFFFYDPNSIVDLVQSLSLLQKLEEVELCWKASSFKGGMTEWVPAVFQSLRVLKLDSIDFKCSGDCLLVRQLICCSPKLGEVVITSISGGVVDPVFKEVPPSYWDEDCIIGQLQTVTIRSFKGLGNELKLVKFLLACSPRLEKMSLAFNPGSDQDSQFPKFLLGCSQLLAKMSLRYRPHLDQASELSNASRISKELLKFHRASSKAEIDFSYQ